MGLSVNCQWLGLLPKEGHPRGCSHCGLTVSRLEVVACRERSHIEEQPPAVTADDVMIEEIGGCRYLGPPTESLSCGCGGESTAMIHSCSHPNIGECLVSLAVRTSAIRKHRQRVEPLGCCETCPRRESLSSISTDT